MIISVQQLISMQECIELTDRRISRDLQVVLLLTDTQRKSLVLLPAPKVIFAPTRRGTIPQ